MNGCLNPTKEFKINDKLKLVVGHAGITILYVDDQPVCTFNTPRELHAGVTQFLDALMHASRNTGVLCEHFPT